MHRLLQTAVLSLACLSVSAEPVSEWQFPSKGLALLTAANAPAVFRQCSRDAPTPSAQLWSPSLAEIAELEDRLQDFLLGRKSNAQRTPPTGIAYHREYVGFMEGKTRLIYANFFPAQLDRPNKQNLPPVVVCDGGSAFWGVVYNPATKAFSEPQFNGPT